MAKGDEGNEENELLEQLKAFKRSKSVANQEKEEVKN